MYATHRVGLAAALLLALALVSLTLLAAGCGSSASSQFYTLTPIPAQTMGAAPASGAGPCLSLGIGPVELPAYLERPQIVSRAPDYRFELAEFNRWIEPLPDTVVRVLAENLTKLVCAEPVLFYPWGVTTPLDRQVTVQILRMDGPLGGEVELLAMWSVLDGKGQTLAWRQSSFTRQCADGSFGAYTQAQSELLADLSREIAASLRAKSATP